MTPATGTLDEAYERLHATGPEFDGGLSNHGPMAAEALVCHGHADLVTSWLDEYMLQLEEFPRGTGPIGADWQQALGDPRRVADWTAFFGRELGEQPWQVVLNAWWPRLLPGVVAAATHGVIRVGHAVRVQLADGEGGNDRASDGADVRIAELAHGLAYWAARWQTMPAGHAGAAAASAAGQANAQAPADSLAAVPRIADQSGGILDRIGQLGRLPSWPGTLAGFSIPAEPERMTVSATFARAAEHGDEHVIKFADTAVEGFTRTGNPDAIAAALRATALIEA